MTAELNGIASPPWQLPGISVTEPGVGRFDLPSVADGLIEDAVFVSDAVTCRWNLKSRQRIHVACREAAEAPVSEAGLFLGFENVLKVQAQRLHCLLNPIRQT